MEVTSLGVGTASALRKRRSLILSLVGCFPWVGCETGDSVVWRIGGALLEVPRLPSCVGVALQGLDLGVLNHSLS